MKTNQAGLDLIKHYESFRSAPYLCPAGVATIGFGSTRYADGRKVTMVDRPLTEEEAEELLMATLVSYERDVEVLVTVPLNEDQFSALVSFAYNLGSTALKGSTLLKKLNAGDYLGAADEFRKWVKGGGQTLPGLVRRRESERSLFLQ